MSIPFERACAQVESVLAGRARQELADDVAGAPLMGQALARLREYLRANTFKAGAVQVYLDKWVAAYDARTRAEGFHALHDWDGVAQRVNPDSIPIDVLDFIVDQRGGDPANPVVPAILLDYYFMHILSLLALRAWDTDDPNASLDHIGRLLALLQGPGGSGQRFADSAETLILIATSHYEPNEAGYDLLLDRVRTLDAAHQLRVALGHAASMGCHLRFGFEAQCGRDTVLLRSDNVADYPWLCFALSRVMREYVRLRAAGIDGCPRRLVVESLLNGLTPDARAFVGPATPAPLARAASERDEFAASFARYRDDLLGEFEALRPSDGAYSPLAFFFNFSHNVVKGTVVDALLWDEPWDLGLDDLFRSVHREGVDDGDVRLLATTLMGYARAKPDRIRGRPMPVIVYDPAAGRQAFTAAMGKLRE